MTPQRIGLELSPTWSISGQQRGRTPDKADYGQSEHVKRALLHLQGRASYHSLSVQLFVQSSRVPFEFPPFYHKRGHKISRIVQFKDKLNLAGLNVPGNKQPLLQVRRVCEALHFLPTNALSLRFKSRVPD
jgi:hypothetical protein